MSCHVLYCFCKEFLGFQEILVRVQECLSNSEVLELVFLCSDLLRKDLSKVVSARELFTQLQNHDLLPCDDSSLLVELLKIIKRDKLIRDLGLNPQLLFNRVSPYRSVPQFGATSFGTFLSIISHAALYLSLVIEAA